MADAADAQRIQRVSFALAPRDWGSDGATVQQADVSAERTHILTDLDAAAKTGDHDAWMAAADRFINDLSQSELAQVEATLRALTMAQMSTAEREEPN